MAFHDVVEDIFKANQHSIEVRQSLPKSMFSMGNAPVFQTPSAAKHQTFPKFLYPTTKKNGSIKIHLAVRFLNFDPLKNLKEEIT